MNGIAIGLSNNSKEILKRLKKTEFVKDIYIASSSQGDELKNELFQVQKPREILLKKWKEVDLIIFVGSISASMNLLNNRNYLLGSVIVIIFSVPAVIFSVGLINSNENYDSLINILFGILLIVFAINPWASGACLKLALQNN